MTNPFAKLTPGLRLVLAYYLASPLFWLLDATIGWHFRVAFLEDPNWKSLYYSSLLVCALLCYLRPAWTALFALVESAVSIMIHLISFMLPIFTLSATVLEGKPQPTALSVEHVMNFVFAGLVMILSFRAAVASLRLRE